MVERCHGISGAVTRRQHDCIGSDPASVRENDRAYTSVLHLQVCDLCFKPDFAARCLDPSADRRDYNLEPVCADMGLTLIYNVARRAGFCKDRQDFLTAPRLVVDLRIELSIGEGARAALSELHVGSGIQFAALPVVFDVLRSLLHTPPPLKQDRPIAMLCQHQCAEQARRTCADHDGPRMHDLLTGLRELISSLFYIGNIPAAQ